MEKLGQKANSPNLDICNDWAWQIESSDAPGAAFTKNLDQGPNGACVCYAISAAITEKLYKTCKIKLN